MPRKKKNNNGIFYVAISLVVVMVLGLGVIQVGKAQIAKSEVAELAELANALDGNVEAFKAGVAYLGQQVGLDLGGTIGSDIYHDVTFHGEVQLKEQKTSIDIPIRLRATTTDASTEMAGVGGKYKYTGDPALCSNPRLFIWDAVGLGINLGVGTTTEKDGSFLTNTTSRTLLATFKVGTTTDDVGVNLWGGINTTTDDLGAGFANGTYFEGNANASSSEFYVDTNTVFVIDVTYHGATNTEDFTSNADVDTTPGAFYLDCKNVVEDND